MCDGLHLTTFLRPNMQIEEVFERFNTLQALIIGDVMVDAYIWGAVERVSPEAPVPVVRATRRDYRLGGAANVALNIQALGANPILCAVIGNDDVGAKFMERMADRGLNNEGIITSQERPTTVKTRVISGHQHVVRVDEETDSMLSAEEEAQLLERIMHLIASCDVVIFEDYDKGVISENVIAHTVEKARQLGIPTVVDPKKRNFLNYHYVSLFKPNLKELKEGLKIDLIASDRDAIENAVADLRAKLQAEGALITLSEHGVYIDSKSEKHHVEAHLREVSDVSGAGDTVISLAGLCMALGLSPYTVAALSNLGGGLVCEHVGVVPVDKDVLLQEALKQEWP